MPCKSRLNSVFDCPLPTTYRIPSFRPLLTFTANVLYFKLHSATKHLLLQLSGRNNLFRCEALPTGNPRRLQSICGRLRRPQHGAGWSVRAVRGRQRYGSWRPVPESVRKRRPARPDATRELQPGDLLTATANRTRTRCSLCCELVYDNATPPTCMMEC